MITTKTIRLDVTKKYTEPVYLVQYEVDARILDIYLSAGSLPINLTGASVVFYAKKPDGTILFNNCTVVDAVSGHVVYTVTEQMCAVAGDLRCWILVIKDDAELRSIEFKVTVQPSEDDTEAIESTSEFTALDEALAIVANIDALQTALDEALSDIDALQQETQALKTGWIPLNGVATFNSVDNPTGVINVPSGHGIEVGNRVRLSNASRVIYGIVTAVTATTVTFLHEINPSNSQALNLLVDSAITDVCFSRNKVPSGFPIDPRKWTVKYTSTADGVQFSPVAGTWYNIGGSLTVPIGAWRLGYSMQASPFRTTGSTVDQFATLSTAPNSESHPEFTTGGGNSLPDSQFMLQRRRSITVATKTVFYLNCKTITTMTGTNAIRWLWSVWPIPLIIDAECAYL